MSRSTEMTRGRFTQRYAAANVGANVGVFWDINDFPIPDYLDSYAFYEDVKTSLQEKGFTGSFSLHLYADGDPYMPARLVNRFRCPELGVSYIPSGGEFCRDSWILLDILKWSIENPSSNVMILAKNFKEEAAVNISYLDISHNLFLAKFDTSFRFFSQGHTDFTQRSSYTSLLGCLGFLKT
ncbi:uncharacterized protein LOC108846168 isoform X2 [Raphanus sativus]|uniref:Uncharacterized protein LOC108846168 isoform X2 n=1 Tax=Raphanus sativus TaxID=3726 RepID=A0A9W3DBS5_RAPSA|nr:uncharacterized protein LOC108846168 isoform X2 [Raphanus sativus]